MRYWDDDPSEFKLTCAKCRQVWRGETLRHFTDRDLTDRFYMPARPSTVTEVLVWVVDPVTQRRHTAAVPLYKADGLERVKL